MSGLYQTGVKKSDCGNSTLGRTQNPDRIGTSDRPGNRIGITYLDELRKQHEVGRVGLVVEADRLHDALGERPVQLGQKLDHLAEVGRTSLSHRRTCWCFWDGRHLDLRHRL